MSSREEIIIDLYHPMFRKGYLEGRRDGFRDKGALVDKQFVNDFQKLFDDDAQEISKEKDEELRHRIGYLVGQWSSCVIPRQPRENNGAEQQETFLHKIRTTYGEGEEHLVEKIRQLWTIQDELAQTLGEDTFEEMLVLGAELGFL